MEHNLSQYKIFYTVANIGNISKAAKELFISQPAISKAISKLETSLNCTLFNRTSRGVTLTNEGRILYDQVKIAFDALSLGEEAIKKISNLGIGQIKIGVSTTLCKYILLPYLHDFIKEYPHIKITIDCHSTYSTIKLLENNQIDIGLICKSDNMKNLSYYEIGQIEDVFVASQSYLDNFNLREHSTQNDTYDATPPLGELMFSGNITSFLVNEPVSKINKLSYKELLEKSNLMLLDKGNITRMYIDDYFRNNSIYPNQILEINNMDLLIDFAQIGLGVACVVKEFVKNQIEKGEIIEIPLPKPIATRSIGFAFSNHSPLSNSAKTFINFLH